MYDFLKFIFKNLAKGAALSRKPSPSPPNPHFILFFFFFFYFFAISWAAPAAYGGSQARGRIGAIATGLRQSRSNAGSEPRLQPNYTTAHGNAGSLTH